MALPTLPRGLFRSESLESPRGERLLQDAIREVEGLKDLLVGPGVELLLTPREPALPLEPDSGGNTSPGVTANGEARTFNGSIELCRADSDSSQRVGPQEEALQRLVNLYGLLHGLQAAVAQQDTLMEARFPEGPERREKLCRANSRDGEAGRAGAAPVAPEKQATELALLQRQHALLQEELRRCRRLGEERATEAGSLEARLRESEQARALLEREAEEARRQLAALGQTEPLPAEAPWARRPVDPRCWVLALTALPCNIRLGGEAAATAPYCPLNKGGLWTGPCPFLLSPQPLTAVLPFSVLHGSPGR
uniref:Rho/Rac guanine nucleotide exchange factor 2 n=1 Tax=Gorilla gorilla gorilla TaxID=9595 RepID=A0A2I2ZSM8_GORGO